VERSKNTNVIIVGATKRHDLLKTSCVNGEVDKFNRKLHKKMKLYKHAKVIDSVLQRECYTRYGLHLNILRKEQMVQKIVEQVRNSLLSISTLPIPLPWKEMPMVYNQESTDTQSGLTVSRTSGRKRNQPATRGDDFLWIGSISLKA
jgi:hypothetical protein